MDTSITDHKEDLIASKSRTRRVMENTSLVVISLCIALGIGEIILRIGGAGKPEISDPILEFRTVNRPGWDSRGWKNHAPLEQADIVAIGDSQTEGNNATVDDAWPQTLGRLASTSVYQMAMGGYGPVQYAALFDDAVALHPKTVIIGFYLGNDLMDAQRTAYSLEHWKGLRHADFAPPTSSSSERIDYRTVLSTGLHPDSFMYQIYELRLWVRAHSVLYATLGDASRAFRESIGVARTIQSKRADVTALADAHPELVYTEKDPDRQTILSPSYRLEAVSLSRTIPQEGWRIAQERFIEMQTKARAHNIRLIILIIPTKEAVYLEYWKHAEGAIPPSFTEYEKNESILASTIKTFCLKEKFECIFALPTMTGDLVSGSSLYGKTMDGHPITGGYGAIAKSINAYLKQYKPLP